MYRGQVPTKHYVYIWMNPNKKESYRYTIGSRTIIFPFEPFYVGKGQKNRFQDFKRRGQRFLKSKLKKLKIKPDIKVFYCSSEKRALLLECLLIKGIGRRDLKTGPLVNLTNGGEGSSNPSKETRRKIGKGSRGRKKSYREIQQIIESRRNNGRPWHTLESIMRISFSNLGQTISPETREKLSIAHKGRKLPKEQRKKISKALKGRPSSLGTVLSHLNNQTAARVFYVKPPGCKIWLKIYNVRKFCKLNKIPIPTMEANTRHLGIITRGPGEGFRFRKASEYRLTRDRKKLVSKPRFSV